MVFFTEHGDGSWWWKQETEKNEQNKIVSFPDLTINWGAGDGLNDVSEMVQMEWKRPSVFLIYCQSVLDFERSDFLGSSSGKREEKLFEYSNIISQCNKNIWVKLNLN